MDVPVAFGQLPRALAAQCVAWLPLAHIVRCERTSTEMRRAAHLAMREGVERVCLMDELCVACCCGHHPPPPYHLRPDVETVLLAQARPVERRIDVNDGTAYTRKDFLVRITTLRHRITSHVTTAPSLHSPANGQLFYGSDSQWSGALPAAGVPSVDSPVIRWLGRHCRRLRHLDLSNAAAESDACMAELPPAIARLETFVAGLGKIELACVVVGRR